jgi:hypothetical protein
MKTKNAIIVISAAIILAGCLMKSIHPFYSEEKVVFDRSLIGTWTDQDSGLWQFSQYVIKQGFGTLDTVSNSYLVKLWDKESEASYFNVHLFELKGVKYLDFYPIMKKVIEDDFYSAHILPLHSIAKLDFEKDSMIHIRWYNEEWINKLIQKEQVIISHQKVVDEGDTTLLITADTKDLQQFFIEHGSDSNAFMSDWGDKDKEAFSFCLKKQN